MEKKITGLVFLAALMILFALILVFPDQTLSRQERRPLRKFPAVNMDGILSGAWEKKLEAWLPDQFPFREAFRSGALFLRIRVLGAKDYQGVYEYQGYLNKIVYPLEKETCRRFGRRAAQVLENCFPGCKAYVAIIPEKGILPGAEEGRPGVDFSRLVALCTEGLGNTATYLPVEGLLARADFYTTDIHWRQERLLPVAAALCDAMGAPLPYTAYRSSAGTDFYGSYFASWPHMEPDTIRYLNSVYTETATVTYYGNDSLAGVYHPDRLVGMDAYDVFLSGAAPLIFIENTCPVPSARGRTLVLLRDSFGSALAPLLLPGYERLVVADLRYMDEGVLKDAVGVTADADVLFLYCMESVNTGGGLR